jgi:6-phosphogluconate dehydrogenase
MAEMKKEIGIIGLGKMGGNMARRLLEKGWNVVGLDRTPGVAESISSEGLIAAHDYKELIEKLPAPRVMWLMVPAGKAVDETLFGENGLAAFLSPGDIVIDGGNSFYKEAAPRGEKLKQKGILFMDVGTSGGPAGARNGACLMVGGSQDGFVAVEPLFKDLAKEDAYRFFEGWGAGHFVKMVHNGIEYGMMQALAEGFEILKKSSYGIDLSRVTEIYNNGSVIESRLVGWLSDAFKTHGPELSDVSSAVAHTGEGAWTVETAKEMNIDVPVIADSLQFRINSEKNPRFAGKILSALRGAFGGHATK